MRKLQDVKLAIDQFGFQLDGSAVPRENEIVDEQARLSDKLTVLVIDIGTKLISESYNNSYNRVKITPQGGVIFPCDGVKLTPSGGVISTLKWS